MKRRIQLWVQWQTQSADSPQGKRDWTLVYEGNMDSQLDLATLIGKRHDLEKDGNTCMQTRDLDIDFEVNK